MFSKINFFMIFSCNHLSESSKSNGSYPTSCGTIYFFWTHQFSSNLIIGNVISRPLGVMHHFIKKLSVISPRAPEVCIFTTHEVHTHPGEQIQELVFVVKTPSISLRRHLPPRDFFPRSCSSFPTRRWRRATRGDDDDDDTMAFPRGPVHPSRPGRLVNPFGYPLSLIYNKW